MENGAKNKAILLSPWGTSGQYLCQAAANFPPDYFRTALILSAHIQTNKTLQGLFLRLSQCAGWGFIHPNTHLHSLTHPLTCLPPNWLISIWDKLRKWRRGKGNREMGQTELLTPMKDFNQFMGQSDWLAPSFSDVRDFPKSYSLIEGD